MKNLTFHIVGLTHNDVKGHEVEYAKEAEGRTICFSCPMTPTPSTCWR